MPIYEYICTECDARFEAIRSISKADEPISCETCQSTKTRRAVSAAFAHSEGRVVAGGRSSNGCGSCSGGSCSTCGV
ncbi:MAG: zinc ribbon domain-containing protein [Chloroflexi bacterium]|nr:zinc ribbon domain-containing protein [Chloroflexota bacterium]